VKLKQQIYVIYFYQYIIYLIEILGEYEGDLFQISFLKIKINILGTKVDGKYHGKGKLKYFEGIFFIFNCIYRYFKYLIGPDYYEGSYLIRL
jgi:hypothetical protein